MLETPGLTHITLYTTRRMMVFALCNMHRTNDTFGINGILTTETSMVNYENR